LSACGVVRPGSTIERPARFAPQPGRVVLAPVVNYTDVPQAGLRALALLEPSLRLRGADLLVYPASLDSESMFEPGQRKAQEQALQWAREQKARYVVNAAVNEWRYKTGIDGEPAVGLAIQVVDLQDGRVVYAASGGRTGWAREGLAAVAQQLLDELLAAWARTGR
jgi:hypothetical protein